jgi:hypothetical protein
LFTSDGASYDPGIMAQLPVESDFKVDVLADRVAVHLGPTRSIYTFARFVGAREIAEFGPISPDPVIQHVRASVVPAITMQPKYSRWRSGWQRGRFEGVSGAGGAALLML